MLIEAEQILTESGEPVKMELKEVATTDEAPMALYALVMPTTSELAVKARETAKAQLEAMATLMGREVPDGLFEQLEEATGGLDEPFELCWN